MNFIDGIIESCTLDNFNEAGYLAVNKDVVQGISDKFHQSGLDHFIKHGHREGRKQVNFDRLKQVPALRKKKAEKIEPLLDLSLEYQYLSSLHKWSFLTPELAQSTGIVETFNISSHTYGRALTELIDQYAEGMILDCGAGMRSAYYSNVVNFEIVNYWSTDVLGVGEQLPFKSESFDAVFSIAVLEHVKDPFRCASEIARVLKRGGTLISAIPFLQPYHGYPHHYYNMTYQGHQNLYADKLKIRKMEVIDSFRPINSLSWFLNSYLKGLPEDARDKFGKMQVRDLIAPFDTYLDRDIVTKLSEEANLELACGTLIVAEK